MLKTTITVLIPLITLLAGCAGTSNVTQQNQQPISAPAQTINNGSSIQVTCASDLAVFQRAILLAINDARNSQQRCGSGNFRSVPALQWDARLSDAAYSHSADMARNNFFSHTGSDGLNVSDRAIAAGYQWRAIGENIAGGQRTVQSAHEGWMASPGHCRNIMSADFNSVGAACVVDDTTDYGIYWTVVFGSQ